MVIPVFCNESQCSVTYQTNIDAALELIANAAAGGMRDALSILDEDDCDVFGLDLIRERARLAGSVRQAVNLLREKLIGRVLARDVVDEETGEY